MGRRTRRNTRSTSPSSSPPVSTPRTWRRCTPRPTPPSAPTQHRRPRPRRLSRRSDGTALVSQPPKERIASPRSKPLSSVPNKPRNKSGLLYNPCCIISVRLLYSTGYKNVGYSEPLLGTIFILGSVSIEPFYRRLYGEICIIRPGYLNGSKVS